MQQTDGLRALQDAMKIAGFVFFFLVIGVAAFLIIRKLIRAQQTDDKAGTRSTAAVISKRTVKKQQKRVMPTQYTSPFRIEETVWHYITFENERGVRTEYNVTKAQYDMIFEGDKGKLTANGSQFISFKKEGWE